MKILQSSYYIDGGHDEMSSWWSESTLDFVIDEENISDKQGINWIQLKRN